jgi:hypothetical protein
MSRSALKKILDKDIGGTKIVSALPQGEDSYIVFTSDGRAFKLASVGTHCYVAIEQHIGKEAGT